MKRYFLFSDVHGEFSALLSSLEKSGFEPDNKDHILVGVGDYFDRGNENKQILDFLIGYKDKERFQGIYGNHDQMLDHFLRGKSNGISDFIYNGLNKTLNNLSGLDCREYISQFPQLIIDKVIDNNRKIIDFLDSLEERIELGNYEITHAGYSPDTDRDGNDTWTVDNWSNTPYFVRKFKPSADKIYVFGHWHARKLNVLFNDKDEFYNDNTFRYNNYIGLDACTNLSGFVNILVLEDNGFRVEEVKSE
jgi:serine/threonine protein phosphatase 1